MGGAGCCPTRSLCFLHTPELRTPFEQARLNGSKLNRTHLLDLFDSMAGKFGREGDRGVSRYIRYDWGNHTGSHEAVLTHDSLPCNCSSEHNVVLIKDNKW